MDWALGIVVENGRLTVEGLSRGGDFTFGDIADLGTCGVPISSQLVKHKGTFEFSSFVAGSSDDYLKAMGLSIKEQSTNRHMVFEGEFDNVKTVIPALVFMRALFRPTRHFLPSMFRAQALDRVRYLDFSQYPVKVVMDVSCGGYSRSGIEVEQCAAWMSFFPSAIRLAASIHEFAMRGEIGMVMPYGSARVTMHGLKLDGVFFVTEMRVISVHADEEPILAAVGCSADFKLRDVNWNGNLKRSLTEVSKVPIINSGDLDVSDIEWTAIEPILLKGQRRNREKINQRHLFDAILQKINFGTSWKKLVSKSGNGNNARFAERTWRSRGTLLPSLGILMKMRT